MNIVRWTPGPAAPAADDLARFFVDHVPPHYVTPGDALVQRTTPAGAWLPPAALRDRLAAEFGRLPVEGWPRVYLAKDGPTVLGLVRVSHAGPAGLIEDLLVATGGRGRGVGKALVDAACAALSRADVTRVHAEVATINGRAGRFFMRRTGATVKSQVVAWTLP